MNALWSYEFDRLHELKKPVVGVSRLSSSGLSRNAVRVLGGFVCLMLLPRMLPDLAAQQVVSTKEERGKAHLILKRVSAAPSFADFEGMKAVGEIAQQMVRVEGFTARVPVDDIPSTEPTEVYIGYDSKTLYAVFLCFDSQPKRMRARLPNRDDIFSDDSITFQIDTFHDQQRAYSVGVNAGGIQGDGVWVEGTGWDLSFDTLYKSQVKRTSRGYIALLAIPFKSLRFPTGPSQHWGLLLNRYIARTTEDTFWPRYSTRIQSRLAQMADLEIPETISGGRNMQFIPYTTFANSRQLDQRNPTAAKFDTRNLAVRPGIDDAKVVLHDRLVLDFTVNPDFSQVESDDPQVLVNQRFEVFFPEKRHFFIENASYFNSPIQLLFTRRIEKPDAGVRVTGKLGSYGLGFLMADDRGPGQVVPDSDPNAGQRALFSIGRVTRDFGPQRFVGLMFTRRQFGPRENIDAATDTTWKINSNWRASAQAVLSWTQDQSLPRTRGDGLYAGIFRDGSHLTAQSEYKSFSPQFQADSGFVPRVDIRNIASQVQYKFLLQDRKLVNWGPIMAHSATWDHAGTLLEYLAGPSMVFNFRDATLVQGWIKTGATYLRPLDFQGLQSVQRYDFRDVGGTVGSTPSNLLTFAATFDDQRLINFIPAVGQVPGSARAFAGNSTVSVRPTRMLTIDNTYFYTQLADEVSRRRILLDQIMRSRWLYQFDGRWSIRLTGQYEALLPNSLLTSAPLTKQFNGDFLLTYRINLGTALYVGYNHDLQNYDPRLKAINDQLARTDRGFLNDGRLFFVKLSYLFQY
jgi:hypothetical protein